MTFIADPQWDWSETFGFLLAHASAASTRELAD